MTSDAAPFGNSPMVKSIGGSGRTCRAQGSKSAATLEGSGASSMSASSRTRWKYARAHPAPTRRGAVAIYAGLALAMLPNPNVAWGRQVDRPTRSSVVNVSERCNLHHNIEIIRIATLASPNNQRSFIASSKVHEDGAGNYWVVPGDRADEITLFSGDGVHQKVMSFADSTFGYINAAAVARADTALLFWTDRAGSRWMDIITASERISRNSYPVSGVIRSAIVDERNKIIAHADVRTAESAGYPAHELSRDGRLIRSFGSTEPILDPYRPMLLARVIASGTAGSVWATHLNEYRIERFDSAGALELSIRRSIPAFPRWEQQSETPVSITVGSFQIAENSLLVVIDTITEARRAWPTSAHEQGELLNVIMESYHGFVEILDLEHMCVAASGGIDKPISGVTSSGKLYAWRTNNSARVIDVYAVRPIPLTGGDNAVRF